MLADAIYARLSGDAAVAALVGTSIEPGTSTSTDLPLIIYDIDQEPDETLGQDSTTQHYTVTIGIEAATRAQADQIAAAVKAALNDAEWTTGDTKVIASTLTGSAQDSAGDGQNPEETMYGVEQTYSIWADN